MNAKGFVDYTNSLHRASDNVAIAKDAEELEHSLSEFLAQLERIDPKQANVLSLNAICNNVCAKLLVTFLGSQLSRTASAVFIKMLNMGILPPIYKVLAAHLDTDALRTCYHLYRSQLEELGGNFTGLTQEALIRMFEHRLEQLTNVGCTNIKLINRNFGYALLDLQGNFIWCDEKSLKVFEMQTSDPSNQNLFELMIPFSKRLLRHKLGGELFAEDSRVGSSKTFSYVIYSKTSMNQYLKCVKRIDIKCQNELRRKLKEAEGPNSLYHKYLRTLTSRATVIVLKFSKAEFRNILEQREYKIQVTETIADLVGHIDSEPNRSIDLEHRKMVEEDRLNGRVDPFGADVAIIGSPPESANQELTQLQDQIDSINSNNAGGSEVVLTAAILLETRYSTSFPSFDYNLMTEDDVIRRFEDKILNKVQKEA